MRMTLTALKCVFGHDWDDCKCRRTGCSAILETAHSWQGFRCVRCGARRDAQHDWDGCVCRLCSSSRHDWDEYHTSVVQMCVGSGTGLYEDQWWDEITT